MLPIDWVGSVNVHQADGFITRENSSQLSIAYYTEPQGLQSADKPSTKLTRIKVQALADLEHLKVLLHHFSRGYCGRMP